MSGDGFAGTFEARLNVARAIAHESEPTLPRRAWGVTTEARSQRWADYCAALSADLEYVLDMSDDEWSEYVATTNG